MILKWSEFSVSGCFVKFLKCLGSRHLQSAKSQFTIWGFQTSNNLKIDEISPLPDNSYAYMRHKSLQNVWGDKWVGKRGVSEQTYNYKQIPRFCEHFVVLSRRFFWRNEIDEKGVENFRKTSKRITI